MSNYPEYLQEVLHPITANVSPYFIKNENWFNSLTWKGQVKVNSEELFSISYSGKLDTDGFIYTDTDEPLIIKATLPLTNRSIILFDERIHGFNAFINKSSQNNIPLLKNYTEKYSYKVYIYGSTSTDFEDEFTVIENHLIQIDDTTYTLDYLQLNAFDFLGIIAVHDDREIKLCEIELV